jgi:hypothetical protein
MLPTSIVEVGFLIQGVHNMKTVILKARRLDFFHSLVSRDPNALNADSPLPDSLYVAVVFDDHQCCIPTRCEGETVMQSIGVILDTFAFAFDEIPETVEVITWQVEKNDSPNGYGAQWAQWHDMRARANRLADDYPSIGFTVVAVSQLVRLYHAIELV